MDRFGFSERKLKEFLVFGYEVYYPRGGLQDLIGSFDTYDEAVEAAKKCSNDNVEIIRNELDQR